MLSGDFIFFFFYPPFKSENPFLKNIISMIFDLYKKENHLFFCHIIYYFVPKRKSIIYFRMKRGIKSPIWLLNRFI